MRHRVMTAMLMTMWLVAVTPAVAATPDSDLQIASPGDGSEVGGVVSVLGTMNLPGALSYALEFGEGDDPMRWIAIGSERTDLVVNGRLGFWDTTRIPDGVYTLRLRAVVDGGKTTYRDVLVRQIVVSNAPRTPTRIPTLPPTATSTPTATPTDTPMPSPTLALDDGVSPLIYLSVMDQYDPLCPGWRQRYSIWISNVGMVTVTNVILTDTLALGCEPVLYQSTIGAKVEDERNVQWLVGDMVPGQALKYELEIEVPTWVGHGQWLENRAIVSSDQVPYVAKHERSLLSDCPWLKETSAARSFAVPTARPSATPTPTSPPTAEAMAKPSLIPTATTIAISVPSDAVDRSLDILTIVLGVVLVALLVLTGVLIYKRVAQRR